MFDVNVLFMLELPSVALRAQRCSIVPLTLSLKQGVDFFFVLSKQTIEKGSWVNLWALEGCHNFFLMEILKIISFSPPRGPSKKVGGPISM